MSAGVAGLAKTLYEFPRSEENVVAPDEPSLTDPLLRSTQRPCWTARVAL